MKYKILLSLSIGLILSGCASQITVEENKDYCTIESPTLTAWAYNQKGYYHLKKVCKDASGNNCSEELLKHSQKPKFNVVKLDSLIAEREKQKLLCGNKLPNDKRYLINDDFYNKILSNMKSKVKNKEGSSLWNDWFQ